MKTVLDLKSASKRSEKLTCTALEARDAWQGFLRAYKVVKERLDRELANVMPLSLIELDVLWLVKEAGGRLRYIEISKLVHLSQSRISRQIANLEERGFLTKDATETDRRATFAVLTDAGRQILGEAEEPLHQAWHRHFLHHIQPNEFATFTRIMTSLVEEQGHWIYEAQEEPDNPIVWEPSLDSMQAKPTRKK